MGVACILCWLLRVTSRGAPAKARQQRGRTTGDAKRGRRSLATFAPVACGRVAFAEDPAAVVAVARTKPSFRLQGMPSGGSKHRLTAADLGAWQFSVHRAYGRVAHPRRGHGHGDTAATLRPEAEACARCKAKMRFRLNDLQIVWCSFALHGLLQAIQEISRCGNANGFEILRPGCNLSDLRCALRLCSSVKSAVASQENCSAEEACLESRRCTQ